MEAPKFHVLCPDPLILESFRNSNRLTLALSWHTPFETDFKDLFSPEEIEQLEPADHIFCMFPLTQSDRILNRYIDLMRQAKPRGIDCFVYTFTFNSFDSYDSMIDWLVDLITIDLSGIYASPD